jgi:uncharacterized protein
MHPIFNEDECLHTIRHYLPAQATLKDFVHHNSLHSFDEKEFFKAIFSASEIFGFKVTFNINTYRKLHKQGRIREEIIDLVITKSKGAEQITAFKEKMLNGKYRHTYLPRVGQLRANWKTTYKIDLDGKVQPLLFRILASYLDQGIALWHFPFEDQGLINAIKILEKNSFSSFFKSKRAQELLHKEDLSISKLLKLIVGNHEYYTNYLFDQQYAHKGWSGLIGAIEQNQNVIFYKKKIAFKDLVILELLLEIDALDHALSSKWRPLAQDLNEQPIDYLSDVPIGEFEEILQLWQEAFEWDYYDEVLSGVATLAKTNRLEKPANQSFQSIFCIDDRECSLRRHLEVTDPLCETLGAPGFFGAVIYFQPFGAKFYDKNCPVVASPKHLIKEISIKQKRPHEIFHSNHTHTFFKGFLSVLSLGAIAAFRMVSDLLNPKMQPDISNAFAHMDIEGELLIENEDPSHIENGLQIGFTVEEMTQIVKSLLQGIGLVDHFAPIVYIIAHGSSSANNPHHGAHDCGACSGRPGAVNARVFAFMVNHRMVRLELSKVGFIIPSTTHFIAAMHDTASDEMAFYDDRTLNSIHAELHIAHKATIDTALDLNAKERSRRFSSIDITKDIKHIRNAIKQRSVSYFEPRPELGHGTNALCHVGSRQKLKGLFLDRRAFLQSYDYRTDPEGILLARVMAPLPVVCGGINLEYYFSRMDIEKMGCGTKLPHNVTGLIGVTNSSDGDIRSGLPLQMIENHDPVRLLLMIEHKPEVILRIIKSTAAMYQWFEKGWIHLISISPEDGQLYLFRKGQFESYTPLATIRESADFNKIINNTAKMSSNHILDATKENIPTYVYSQKIEA